jgi:transposase
VVVDRAGDQRVEGPAPLGQRSSGCLRHAGDRERDPHQGRTGCQWAYLPHDLPQKSATYYYFAAWRDDGTDQVIHELLRCQVRERARRSEDPTLVVLDTQSVHVAAGVPAATSGHDPAKRVPGRKRGLAVDVLGLGIDVEIVARNPQDKGVRAAAEAVESRADLRHPDTAPAPGPRSVNLRDCQGVISGPIPGSRRRPCGRLDSKDAAPTQTVVTQEGDGDPLTCEVTRSRKPPPASATTPGDPHSD